MDTYREPNSPDSPDSMEIPEFSIKLDFPEDWEIWYCKIKLIARTNRIRGLIDPDAEDMPKEIFEPPERPTFEPGMDKEKHKYRRMDHDLDYEEYLRTESYLHAVDMEIIHTIPRRYVSLITGCTTTQQRLRILKKEFCS